jgi:hypothetical protein
MMNVTSFFEHQGFTGDLPGASNHSLNLFALQPPLPFPLKNGKALTIRPLLPFIFSQPVYQGEGTVESSGAHFGNVSIDFLYGGTNAETGVLSGVGMLLALPTASSSDIRGEWAVGPSVLYGVMKEWGVALLLINQSWQLSGASKQAILSGQYALAFSLPKGWQFVSSPPFSYNWDTKDLTLPIGGGPFRTVLFGKTPVKLGLQLYYYAASPDALGPEWSIRFQIQPSLKRPW